jgi:hypothetical protein
MELAGGQPNPNRFLIRPDMGHATISQFFDPKKIADMLEDGSHLYGNDLIPIAQEGTGDEICFNGSGVYYVAHDYLDGPDRARTLLAPTWSDFIEMVEHSEDDNLQRVVDIFASIGTMSWLSFVQNRLPLLKLTPEILAALERGEIAYTKAQAIARIKDEEKRLEVLGKAIAENLSLTQIKELIAGWHGTQQKASKDEMADRLDNIYRQMKKAKVWQDPQKQKKLIKALETLENLLTE